MKKGNRFIAGLVFFGLLISSSAVLFSSTKYSVFCANGKVEVDSRTLDQMKSARGSGTCLLKEFNYLSDADSYAKTIGGKGASCKCN
jgi:hypothetical protein